MKATILSILLLLSIKKEESFPAFVKSLPEGWSTSIKGDTLLMYMNAPLRTYYCGYNEAGYEDTITTMFVITILRQTRLSAKELSKRAFAQDSILQDLERNYKRKPDITNASALMYFENNRNRIPNLKLPFSNDEQHSYFIDHNYPWGHCSTDPSIRKRIEMLYKKISKRSLY